jgi:hypothetical protein
MALALLLVLGILIVYSYSDKGITLFGMVLKKPAVKEFLTNNDHKSKQILQADTGATAHGKLLHNKAVTAKAITGIIDSSPQRILMVGESMIEGLMFPFMKYAKFNHHTLKAKIWYGSRLLDWGGSDTLKKLVQEFNPTFTIISIGSNELFVRNIEERDPYVKKIVEQMGDRKFIWVGPPNPKKDNGINDLIMQNTGADRFFVSKYMHFERRRDGVHPKPQQCYRWADSISEWIMTKSRYPILLKKAVLDSQGNVVLPELKGDSGRKDSIISTRRRTVHRKKLPLKQKNKH